MTHTNVKGTITLPVSIGIRGVARKALEEYIIRIKSKFSEKIEKIIVFGSYARGENLEGSDIDVLVGNISLKELVDETIS